MHLHCQGKVTTLPFEASHALTGERHADHPRSRIHCYQTTVPETVRRALRLGKRDKTHYTIRPSGEVVLTRAESSAGDDPVLGQFLGFLARDIANHPERLQAADFGLVQRLRSLVGEIEINLNTGCSSVTTRPAR